MISLTDCPVCGNNQLKSFLSCVDHTVSHETFHLKECTRCGFVITTPRPADYEIGNYYLSEKYISHTSKAASLIDRIYLTARTYTLNWKLKLINEYTAPDSAGENKILDYGCGTGEFLKNCKDNGWHVTGVEPSDEARKKSQSLTSSTITSSIESIDNQLFNTITLWHVLEHVPNLDATIQQLKSRLTEHGTIFIAVPNHNSWDGKYYEQHWAGYDVPRHLWHFSRQSMKLLMEKNSLQITKILPMKLDAFYISLLSEKYKNHKSGPHTMISAMLKGMKSNIQASKTGDYSSLIYIVKK